MKTFILAEEGVSHRSEENGRSRQTGKKIKLESTKRFEFLRSV